VGFVKKNKYEIGIIFLIVLRGILNAIVPLMDKTEARYAEIARIMQETNNYITPQIDYGVPFWAKTAFIHLVIRLKYGSFWRE
jgi:4-amino-4-deoxy-L-arabinose transferase-like glycosyltransferase